MKSSWNRYLETAYCLTMVRKVRMWPVHGDQGRNQPVVQALEMSFRAFQVYFHYLQQQEAETLQIATLTTSALFGI